MYMIHGIYLKSRPKGMWHLVSVAASPEAANHDYSVLLKQIKLEGNGDIQLAIQAFESSYDIPELLKKVKEQKLMYN
jgi:hypothetical protein